MSKKKGEETKQHIIKTTRTLLYEKGYENTTSRMISEAAGTNLGLINYYFKGKGGIARYIYQDIRTSFENALITFQPDLSELDKFFLSSSMELHLCLNHPEFAQLFLEVTSLPETHEILITYIQSMLEKYTHFENVSADNTYKHYAALAAVSVSAVKASLIRYYMDPSCELTKKELLHYYLVQQLDYFHMDETLASSYLDTISHYYIALADGFTPVMTPLVI